MSDRSLPKNGLVPLENPFIDPRGRIQPLVDETMKSALLIESKKGAVRGNHYHKTDWHYCYMISGLMEYYERPIGSQEKPTPLLVRAGEMVFTSPNVEHAMRFLEDTVWVTLSRNQRDQKNYESDIVRVKLLG